jgi:hypothetical protein
MEKENNGRPRKWLRGGFAALFISFNLCVFGWCVASREMFGRVVCVCVSFYLFIYKEIERGSGWTGNGRH